MKDIDGLVTGYRLRLEQGLIARSTTGTTETQVENYRAHLVDWQTKQRVVKKVLGSLGIQTIMYMSYLTFASQVDKAISRTWLSGESLIREIERLTDIWTGRGLRADALRDICIQVFSIPWVG